MTMSAARKRGTRRLAERRRRPRPWRLMASAAAASALFLAGAAVPALANSPDGAGAAIDNGSVQLGVNDWGNLNFLPPDGGTPSTSGDDGSGTNVIGLRLLRAGDTPLEATADGCTCEGWGIADAGSGISGSANDSGSPGYDGLKLISFTHDDHTATSVTETDGTISSSFEGTPSGTPPTLRVTQKYEPAPTTPLLYQDTVTVENVGTSTANDIRYRRVMDWDIEPTQFDEFSTIGGTDTPALLFSSDQGFDTADPLGDRGYYEEPQCSGEVPTDGVTDACTGFFTDAGPDDHGAHFDFGFGELGPGESKTFTVFYGAATSEAAAADALTAVGAEVYSLGQSDTDDGPSLGTPATFVFAFTTRTAADLEGAAPGMTLDAPATVGLGADGTPNAFPLSAALHNYGHEKASDLRVTLDLPAGLTLARGDSPHALGDLSPGGDTSANWSVKPSAQCEDATYHLGAAATWTEGARPLTSGRSVTVHGTCGRIFGVVTGFDRDGLRGLSGATVDLCPATGDCSDPVETSTTSSSGRYELTVHDPGDYRVMAAAVAPFRDPASQTSDVIRVDQGADREQDFSWEDVDKLDADTSVGGPGLVDVNDGLPTLYWEDESTVTKAGCPSGTTGEQSARYRIVSAEDADGDGEKDVFQDWTAMAHRGDGSFAATIPALYPHHGDAHFEFEVTCGSGVTPSGFDVYIDPSGVVVDQAGKPVVGATVTLLRYQGAALGYVRVPDGSSIMSPANRTNPDRTDAAGHFGWDVTAGGYVVRAAKSGCTSATDPSQPYAESDTLTIPPPVTDLRVTLACSAAGGTPPATTPPQSGAPPVTSGSGTPQGPTPTTGLPVRKHKAAKPVAKVGKVKIRRHGRKATVNVVLRIPKRTKARLALTKADSAKPLRLLAGSKVGKHKLKHGAKAFTVKMPRGKAKVQLATRTGTLKKHHKYALEVAIGGKRVLRVPFKA